MCSIILNKSLYHFRFHQRKKPNILLEQQEKEKKEQSEKLISLIILLFPSNSKFRSLFPCPPVHVHFLFHSFSLSPENPLTPKKVHCPTIYIIFIASLPLPKQINRRIYSMQAGFSLPPQNMYTKDNK